MFLLFNRHWHLFVLTLRLDLLNFDFLVASYVTCFRFLFMNPFMTFSLSIEPWLPLAAIKKKFVRNLSRTYNIWLYNIFNPFDFLLVPFITNIRLLYFKSSKIISSILILVNLPITSIFSLPRRASA